MPNRNTRWSPVFLAAIFFVLLLVVLSRSCHDTHPFNSGRRGHGVPSGKLPAAASPGLPLYKGSCQQVRHMAYTLCYDEDDEEARWVAYTLHRSSITDAQQVQRSEDFRTDPAVKTGSARLEDYRHSGYDRGHLAPAGDMKWNEKAMSESFLLSNITPQNHSFNEGIWGDLENQVRRWARLYGTVYVVTGPVLEGNMPKIGPDGVSVPPAFYKAILITSPEIRCIGFIIPNAPGRQSFWHYAVPVASIEQRTGIDLFNGLPDDIENTTEHTLYITDWYTHDRPDEP